MKAILYAGPPLAGKPTRVFAWLGLPAGASAEHKVPAMVLVHGGGGTARAYWVRHWTERGYGALAMDTCGSGLSPDGTPARRMEDGGPAGWDDSFAQVDRPVEDQWGYHAVANIVLANSLLRSLSEIDADRIGLTGASWGGQLVCIAAGVDPRFKFVVPVYGCGFLGEDSVLKPKFEAMGPEQAGRWLSLWDPSIYLPHAQMPLLWVTGDLDFAYPLSSLQKSYRLPPGERYLSVRHPCRTGKPP